MNVDWQSGPSAEVPRAPWLAFGARGAGLRATTARWRRPRPELVAVLLLAAILYTWSLTRNGWANSYYTAAVRSMSSSWHNFLFASLDPSGVMTVDKPPLALWVEALSVRAFGFSSLSMLLPQALMGIASVGLLYDLVQRRFGRIAGFLAALALALTPITVAISRYNQPDALLVLCSVAALWFAVRGLEADTTRSATRLLVLAGVCVGLGFETKMLVALVVVPGIALAWLWTAPGDRDHARPRLRALRQLVTAGGAMAVVGGAWPLLVELTPAADRPWISGTSDNRVWSLIFEYNGVGRVDGQAGGPGGLGGGSVFGGQTGPLRLLNSALGGQGGWLLGFAAVSAIGLLIVTRVRRADARTGWLLAVGGSFLVTAALFSFASGIFHPYYVSLLAPFTAALFGAGAAFLISGRREARRLAPVAIAAGVATELAVLGDYSGRLTWLVPVLIATGLAAAVALVVRSGRRERLLALAAVCAALLVAPGVWAFDTLGRSITGTFPEGGPANAQLAGGFGGPRRLGAGPPGSGFGGAGAAPGGGPRAGTGAPPFGGKGASGGAGPWFPGARGFAPPLGGGAPGGAGPGAAGFGNAVSSPVLSYVKAHGGGTIAVASQSSAADSIVARHADVAGIGGFSGRESDVSVAWLAQEVRGGNIRWVLGDSASAGGGFGRGAARDSRSGSNAAIAAAERECRRVTVESEAASQSGLRSDGAVSTAVLYDCAGRAAALSSLAT